MSAPTEQQLQALLELWKLAQHDHGGANVAVKFLLGLYNGQRFPFDLTELRRLDAHNMGCALQVLALDWSPSVEVHVHLSRLTNLNAMGARFELLACRWRLKGRCNKEAEADCRNHVREAQFSPAEGLAA
jgi:hypothetical protein